VQLVDDGSFDEWRMTKGASSIVMFFAPWCGHCKALKPEFASAAKTIAESKEAKVAEVTFAAADCVGGSVELCKRFEVKSYPSLLYFKGATDRDGTEFKFQGARNAKAIERFATRTVAGVAKTIDPKKPSLVCDWGEGEEAESRLAGGECGKVALLGDDHWESYRASHKKIVGMLAFFYAPWCGHCTRTKPDFAAASNHVGRSLPFVGVDCDGEGELTCQGFNITAFPTIKYFETGAAAPVDYTQGRESGDFLAFAEGKINAAAKGADGTINYKKLRVKQIKKMLKERGISCKGCTDKSEFVAKLKAHIDKQPSRADGASAKKEGVAAKKGKTKQGRKMSLMEEKRFKEAQTRAQESWDAVEPSAGAQKLLHVHSQQQFEDSVACDSKMGFCAQTLLFFYADSKDGCAKCVASKPALAAAAAADSAWTVATVDCLLGDNHALCARFISHKQKYPVLVHVHGDDIIANISQGVELKNEDLTAYVKSGGEVAQEEDAEAAAELASELDEL
jgi:thiol-disulfide isomerase/thioredoxin